LIFRTDFFFAETGPGWLFVAPARAALEAVWPPAMAADFFATGAVGGDGLAVGAAGSLPLEMVFDAVPPGGLTCFLEVLAWAAAAFGAAGFGEPPFFLSGFIAFQWHDATRGKYR
jgi:hypothetical protein